MSKLIVVEGLDGAGKTTAISTITCQLNLLGIPHQVLREPGGTEIGEWLRTYVKSLDTPILDPQSEILLFFLSRSVLIKDVIEPALAKGTTIVLDRFFRTTLTYQGYGLGGKDLPLIRSLITQMELESLIDLELYLDVDVTTSRSRIDLRFTDCQIEKRNDDFFNQARTGYLNECREHSHIKLINSMQPISAVAEDIQNELKTLYGA